jgi:polyhydroxyalkanoate synthase
MNTWVTDNIPLAGGAFRQLIVDLYRNDRLMKGELMIRGQRVDLSRLRANLLTVIAEGDHITPPCQSEAILSKVGSSDKEPYPQQVGNCSLEHVRSSRLETTENTLRTWSREGKERANVNAIS